VGPVDTLVVSYPAVRAQEVWEVGGLEATYQTLPDTLYTGPSMARYPVYRTLEASSRVILGPGGLK